MLGTGGYPLSQEVEYNQEYKEGKSPSSSWKCWKAMASTDSCADGPLL